MVKWLKTLGEGLSQYFDLTNGQDPQEALLAQKMESPEPWASFEIRGFEDAGRVAVNFNWNPAFAAKIKELGFEAETEEDAVQLFFYTASLRPTSLAADPADEAVQSLAHPHLSQIDNEIRT